VIVSQPVKLPATVSKVSNSQGQVSVLPYDLCDENRPSRRFSESGLLLKEGIFFTGGNLQAPMLHWRTTPANRGVKTKEGTILALAD